MFWNEIQILTDKRHWRWQNHYCRNTPWTATSGSTGATRGWASEGRSKVWVSISKCSSAFGGQTPTFTTAKTPTSTQSRCPTNCFVCRKTGTSFTPWGGLFTVPVYSKGQRSHFVQAGGFAESGIFLFDSQVDCKGQVPHGAQKLSHGQTIVPSYSRQL